MSDLIDRIELMRQIVEFGREIPKDQVIGVIARQEAVEVEERHKGEWIDEDGTYYANCSKCGYQMDTHQERGYFRFCPNCGSDNRGRSE